MASVLAIVNLFTFLNPAPPSVGAPSPYQVEIDFDGEIFPTPSVPGQTQCAVWGTLVGDLGRTAPANRLNRVVGPVVVWNNGFEQQSLARAAAQEGLMQILIATLKATRGIVFPGSPPIIPGG